MITRNSDNLALYGDGWALTDNGAFNSEKNIIDQSLNLSNATYHNVNQPNIWSGGFYTYDGNLTPTESGATAIAEALQVKVTEATQKRLDDFAQTKTYDSMLSACTYVTSSVVRLKAEGQYCVDSRDSTWETLYTILGEVKAGTRPMPDSFADIESELPSLEWPI